MTKHPLIRPSAHWAAAAITAALLVALQLGGDSTASALRYDRLLLDDGQWWRGLTGSLVHAGWPHLAVNLAGLGIAALALGNMLTGWRWAFCFTVSALAVTLGLWLWSPRVEWYLGASGALHGLFIAGTVPSAARREPGATVILAIVTLKLAWEQIAGPLPGSEAAAEVPVVVDAHLYGAVGGLAAAALAGVAPYFRRALTGRKKTHG